MPTASNTDPVARFGIGVFTEGLVTAANFPSPVTDSPDVYLAFGSILGIGSSSFTGAGDGAGFRMIDSKGRRRWDNTDRIVLVVEEVTSGHSINIMFDFDLLFIPDQGR